MDRTGAAHDLQTMPSLRARILAVAGTPVEQFHPPGQSDWPLRSDTGFTFAATPPPGTVLAQGQMVAAGLSRPAAGLLRCRHRP